MVRPNKSKQDLFNKRKAILAEIDRLEKNRCDFCSGPTQINGTYAAKSNCDCDAAAKVRTLGNQLMELVSSRKTTDLEVIEVSNMKNVTMENLTVELYKKMKLAKMRDVDIFREIGIGGGTFSKWKLENGLLKK